jgi:hypothetical protein
MPNQIILPAQTISAQELVNSISGKIKKIFFQCELKSIINNDATFGIIAYAANKKNPQKWDVGTKVTATIDTTKPVKTFSLPLAFGNCEWVNSNSTKKKKGEGENDFSLRVDQSVSMKYLNKVSKNKELLKKTRLVFEAKKSSNPHISFTISIDSGIGNPTAANANPSPPAPPAD